MVDQGASSHDHAFKRLPTGRASTGPDCHKVDPENRLLWRFNRRRLDLEAMHDTLLLRFRAAST